MARQPISRRVRFLILQRDNFTCQYCGAQAPDKELEVDHAHPVAAGGLTVLENLVTACFTCNRGKGHRLLEKVPQSGAWAAKVERQRANEIPDNLTPDQVEMCHLVADAQSRHFSNLVNTFTWEDVAYQADEYHSRLDRSETEDAF